jgi:hypothetical protein
MHTFNLMLPSPQSAQNLGIGPAPRWQTQRQIFSEIGSSETLTGVDKVFFVERRGGGHGESVVPSPDNWHTPRHMYFQTNMLASLPAALAEDGRADTLLTLNVADDVNPETIDHITLRLAISDGTAEGLSVGEKLEKIGRGIEVRINNILLGVARPETVADSVPRKDTTSDPFKDWLVFAVPPRYLALDANLVGVRLSERTPKALGQITVEKLELHVHYR